MSEQSAESDAHKHECAIAPHPPVRDQPGRGTFGCYCTCGAVPVAGGWRVIPPVETGADS